MFRCCPGHEARRAAFGEFSTPLQLQGEGRLESDFLQLSQWYGTSRSNEDNKEIKPRYKQQPSAPLTVELGLGLVFQNQSGVAMHTEVTPVKRGESYACDISLQRESSHTHYLSLSLCITTLEPLIHRKGGCSAEKGLSKPPPL